MPRSPNRTQEMRHEQRTSNSPMLKAAGLWAKTSVKGGQYLTGRLGGVKVLVMENRDRQDRR